MEKPIISAVTSNREIATITITGVPTGPRGLAGIFSLCASHDINVDAIVQTPATDGTRDIAISIPSGQVTAFAGIAEDVVRDTGAAGYTVDENVAEVALVGAGLKTHPDIATRMFEVLAANSISTQMIQTSPIKLTVAIAQDRADDAVAAISEAFELDGAPA